MTATATSQTRNAAVPLTMTVGGGSYFGGYGFERPDGSGFTATCSADEARLIAALSDLYWAVERVAHWNGQGDPADLINQARAAFDAANSPTL